MLRAIIICLVVVVVSACGQRLQSGSVFENLIHNTQQAGKPAEDNDIRTEYPLPQNWGPRIAEYRGDPNVTTESVSRRQGRNERREYSVNFNQAELAEVVRGILLDTLKIGYTLDPNVKGTVTVSSPERISRRELLQLLETVLQMNRAVMIKTGNGYRIVPDTTVRAGTASNVDYVSEQAVLGAGYGISVLPLRHVAGPKIIKMYFA